MFELLFPEYRLDWFGAGPSSPNKTGALLAILFIVSLWPALRFRWGYWLSLPAALLIGVLALQTESRGAFVAVGTTFIILSGFWLLEARRRSGTATAHNMKTSPLKPKIARAIAGLLACGLLLFYSQQLGVSERMSEMTTGEDESANVRIALYSAGLQMIAAAPPGWGQGQAGDAYGQWYQEIGDDRSYLSLVNSHLTWMADYGMLFQFLYIAGWCTVFMLCWPAPWTPLRGITLAAWVTLGLCGFFSSVLTLVWLWVIPVILLILCVFQRFRSKHWPSKRQRLVASYGVLGCCVGLQSVAHAFATGNQLAASPDRVEIGEHPNSVAIIRPELQILGDKYGHTIRDYLDVVSGFTVLHSHPDEVDLTTFERILVSGGKSLAGYSQFKGEIIWMNPSADVNEAVLDDLDGRSLTVVIGSRGDWRRSRVWQSLIDTRPNCNLILLQGVADFIPNWPRYLIEEEEK